jgi:hypothetical protein
MKLRTKVRLFLVALAAFTGLGVAYTAQPAGAVCGGGAPGEPCYCPGFEVSKNGIRWIYC